MSFVRLELATARGRYEPGYLLARVSPRIRLGLDRLAVVGRCHMRVLGRNRKKRASQELLGIQRLRV
jgi:hypothetical protein